MDHDQRLYDEWSPENDGDLRDYPTDCDKSFLWVCRESPIHLWHESIPSRIAANFKCPQCIIKHDNLDLQQELCDEFVLENDDYVEHNSSQELYDEYNNIHEHNHECNHIHEHNHECNHIHEHNHECNNEHNHEYNHIHEYNHECNHIHEHNHEHNHECNHEHNNECNHEHNNECNHEHNNECNHEHNNEHNHNFNDPLWRLHYVLNSKIDNDFDPHIEFSSLQQLSDELNPENDAKLEDYMNNIELDLEWICSNYSDHKWRTSILLRVKNNFECSDCMELKEHELDPPFTIKDMKKIRDNQCDKFCGKKICKHTNLQMTHPKLCLQWDYEKNKLLFPDRPTPDKYTFGSQAKVWWICRKHKGCECHKWQTIIGCRTRPGESSGCPYCVNLRKCIHNDIKVSHPEIIPLWDVERNGPIPDVLAKSSTVRVWWKCNEPGVSCLCHLWLATPHNVTNGTRCAFCFGEKVCIHDNFAIRFKKIAGEWDYSKNDGGPEMYSYGSNYDAWWICGINPCGCHKWQVSIKERTRGNGCPFCNGRPCPHNNFAVCYPHFMPQWDPSNTVNPREISKSYNVHVKWICTKNSNHRWSVRVYDRIRHNSGCPYCRSSKAEEIIAKYLDAYGIKYVRQKTFSGCKDKILLRFDFYIPELNLIIEYDGEQHIYEDAYYAQKDGYENIVYRDTIKTKYCIENDIKIVRISPDEFDIIDKIMDYLINNPPTEPFTTNVLGTVTNERILFVYRNQYESAMEMINSKK